MGIKVNNIKYLSLLSALTLEICNYIEGLCNTLIFINYFNMLGRQFPACTGNWCVQIFVFLSALNSLIERLVKRECITTPISNYFNTLVNALNEL